MGVKKEKTPVNRDFLLATFSSKVTSYMVRVTGLEPARLGHQNLNLARLPFRHTRGDTRLVYALRRVLSIRLQGAADKNRMRGFGRVWTAKEDKIYANSCTKPHYVVLY